MPRKLVILSLAGLAGFVLGLLPGIDDVFVRHTHYADLSMQRFGPVRGPIAVIGLFLPFAFVLAVVGVALAHSLYVRWNRDKPDHV